MPSEDAEYWIDANLPPQLAQWLSASFTVSALSFFELGFLTNSDEEIFEIASAKML